HRFQPVVSVHPFMGVLVIGVAVLRFLQERRAAQGAVRGRALDLLPGVGQRHRGDAGGQHSGRRYRDDLCAWGKSWATIEDNGHEKGPRDVGNGRHPIWMESQINSALKPKRIPRTANKPCYCRIVEARKSKGAAFEFTTGMNDAGTKNRHAGPGVAVRYVSVLARGLRFGVLVDERVVRQRESKVVAERGTGRRHRRGEL